MTTATRQFVPDHRYEGAPPVPTDRPPTRAEVWAHVRHYYADIKTEQEMRDFAAATWIGNYTYWVNVNGWRRQPDWKEGDGIVEEACPTGPIFPDEMHSKVRQLHAIAKERTAP